MHPFNPLSRTGFTALLAAAALALTLSPSAAFAAGQAQGSAAPAKPSGHEHSFGQIDTDHDGRISRTEFAAAHGGKSDRFASIDGNGDGFISQQEFDAHHAAMGAATEGHAPAADGEHAGHH